MEVLNIFPYYNVEKYSHSQDLRASLTGNTVHALAQGRRFPDIEKMNLKN